MVDQDVVDAGAAVVVGGSDGFGYDEIDDYDYEIAAAVAGDGEDYWKLAPFHKGTNGTGKDHG